MRYLGKRRTWAEHQHRPVLLWLARLMLLGLLLTCIMIVATLVATVTLLVFKGSQ